MRKVRELCLKHAWRQLLPDQVGPAPISTPIPICNAERPRGSAWAGGTLADMVQMTVFVIDVGYGERLWQVRKEVFGDNFPGSAMVTVAALANPDAKIEIQGYAVIES